MSRRGRMDGAGVMGLGRNYLAERPSTANLERGFAHSSD